MAIKIGAIIELKDKFSNISKKLSKEAKKDFNNIQRTLNSFKKNVRNTMKAVATVITTGFATSVLVAGKYFKESLMAYKDQNLAITTLTNSLNKQKNMTKEMINETLKFAEAVQSQGVIGDEIIQLGQNELALSGLKVDQIKKLSIGLGDMIAKEKGLNATTSDSINAGKALAKAVNLGKVKALQNYGIYLSETETKMFNNMKTEERVNYLNKKLKDSIGGINKALRNTPEGAMKALKNDFGDIQELVGEKLQPILTRVFSNLMKHMPVIKEKLLELVDKLGDIAPQISNGINKMIEIAIALFSKFLDVITFVSENWNWIKEVAKSFIILIGIFKTVSLSVKAFSVAKSVMRVATDLGILSLLKEKIALLSNMAVLGFYTAKTIIATVVTTAFTTALGILTSPITLIIVGVGLLVASIYLLYKKFDVVKEKVKQFWNVIKDTGPIKFMIEYFKTLVSIFKTIWEFMEKIIGGFSKIVSSRFSKIKNFFGFGNKKEEKVEIPQNALGTPYFKGGLTSINERGGEIVNLPNGSQIIPNDLSKKMINNNDNKKYNITINVNGSNITTEKQAYDVAKILLKELKLQGGNM